MNLERIHQLIKNPSLSLKSDIVNLKELCLKYPYAQLFSILYLKALNNNNDIRFEEELNQFAYKISDRKKLHELLYSFTKETYINTEAENQNIESTSNTILPINAAEDKNMLNSLDVEVKENSVFEGIAQEKENQIEVEKPLIIEEKLVYQEQTDESEQINTSEIETSEIESDKKNKETDILEKEFLANIISSSYSIENEEKKVETKDILNKGEDINTQKKSFSSWLKTANNEIKSNPNEQIIDEFITNKPKISTIETKKNEFYSAPKKAKSLST